MSPVVKRAVAFASPLAAIAWWGATAWLARQPVPWALRLTNPAFAVGLLLTYGAAAVLIVHAARNRRATLFGVAAATMSCGVGLLLLDGVAAANLIDYRPIRSAIAGSEGPDVAFVADQELLYRRASNVRWTGRPQTDMESYFNLPSLATRPLTFSTDRNGFRNLADVEQADIALIGDWYIEGSSVSDRETAAVRLQELTGQRVANLGVSGYGSLQELKVLEKYAVSLHPKMVAWFFFEGNDLDDDQTFENGMMQPGPNASPAPAPPAPVSYRWRGFVDRSFTHNAFLQLRAMTGWLVPNGIDSFGWFGDRSGVTHRFYFYDFYATRAFGNYERWRFERTRAAFRRGLEICRQHHIRLVVFYIPIKFRVYGDLCRFPAGSPCRQWKPWDLEAQFAEFCRTAGIELVSLTGPMHRAAAAGEVVYAPDDSHWNAEGQRFVAEQLARLH